MTLSRRVSGCAVVFVLALLLAGCEPPALLIQPISANRGLTETTIQRDAGLFVFDKIAVIDVDGVLMNDADGGLFGLGENPVALFLEKLDRARGDDDVKAVVLRVNSPGGSVGAADAMHHALAKFRRQTGKPVVTAVTDLCASGSYYVACASDGIIAQPTSIVGSIGVIFQTVSFAGTMDKIGVSAEAIKSGDVKDLASPLKPLSDEERAILSNLVMDFYERFLTVVLDGREELTREELTPIADGRILPAPDALDVGLIDRVGYPDDAIAWAKQLADTDRTQVVIYHRPVGYKPNFYAGNDNLEPASLVNVKLPRWLSAQSPQFLYLWQPNP